MASPAPVLVQPPPHLSFMKRMGHILGQVLGFISKDAQVIEPIAVKVAEALLPQFAAEIQVADNIFSKIVKQAIVTQGLVTATGAATTNAAKFNALLANIGPELDQWVASNLPGVKAVSAINKSNLVQAVIAIANEEETTVALAPAAQATAPTPAA